MPYDDGLLKVFANEIGFVVSLVLLFLFDWLGWRGPERVAAFFAVYTILRHLITESVVEAIRKAREQ